jgi:hypothetical protein
MDPTVPGEDYGLGRVLSSGSTDTAALQEIWKLYTNSVTAGGSLLNLSPIPEPPRGTGAWRTSLRGRGAGAGETLRQSGVEAHQKGALRRRTCSSASTPHQNVRFAPTYSRCTTSCSGSPRKRNTR